MSYLIDSNVLIQAKNTYYGMSFCPAFWDWLDARNKDGFVFSVDRVLSELKAGQDELSIWAVRMGDRFFLQTDHDPLLPNAINQVMDWIDQPKYSSAEIAAFAKGADLFLVAHGLAHGHTVITQEIRGAGKKIKIPNVCEGLYIPCMNTFELLRRERARFVWDRETARA